MGNVIRFTIVILLFALSFFFSSSESAFSTINRLRVERDVEDGKKRSKTLLRIITVSYTHLDVYKRQT